MGRNPKQLSHAGGSARANRSEFDRAASRIGDAIADAVAERRTARAPSQAMLDGMRLRGEAYWRDVKSREPLAEQLQWVRRPEARAMMGRKWCGKKREELLAAQRRLRELVPSGWWYDEAWSRGATFPPQEPYCPLASAAYLYGEAAAGRIRRQRQLYAWLGMLWLGVDPVQMHRRAGSRMMLSIGRASMPTTQYDDYRQPVQMPPTRRLTPPQSAGDGQGDDNHYDRMSSLAAEFCRDAPSVTAMQFQKIGILKGREQSEIDKEKRDKRRALDAKVRAAKAKAGIVDIEPPLVENILDEKVDVDCTDIVPDMVIGPQSCI